MGFRYSLAQVSIEISRGTEPAISFGGNKSMLGSITMSRSNDRFAVEGDATGGYVVNETLDATGDVAISIRQFASLSNTLTKIFNAYDIDSAGGHGALSANKGAVSIKVFYRGALVASANGCFINMPEYAFEEEAGDRDFSFVAGEVLYEQVTDAGQIV